MVTFLAWAINLLLGLVIALVGIVLKQHATSDKEHRERIDGEISLIRKRIHDMQNTLAEAKHREFLKELK